VASSVPKSKGTSIGKPTESAERNPPGRRLKPEKKEEEFAVNLSKKSHGQEDPFLAARFVSVQFRR